VGLIAACILSLALRGRVRQQTRPIGMLRAMGASDGQVRLIYLFVGVLLWLPGLEQGLALAAALSLVTAGLLGLGSAAWASPFWAWPWPQLAAVAGVSGLISVASTLLATNGVVGTPPIELLRKEQA
jgi:ABC-type lipoprotein release transport system permease subunit